jgi:hypothetical protein
MHVEHTIESHWCNNHSCLEKAISSTCYEHVKVSQVFNNNPQGSQLRQRPKNRWWNCVQTCINKCKITNWKERSKNSSDWEQSIHETKVCIGL